MIQVKADCLFEVSWEVCNKVGGIYTVIMSKAALMNEAYKNYFLVGPYIEEKAQLTFVEENPSDELKPVFEALAMEGIKAHFGTWQVKGEPKAILLDTNDYRGKTNELKSMYWDKYQIDSLNSHWDFEEPMVWASAVGRMIQLYNEKNNADEKKKVALHCHEWMAGFALLFLKIVGSKVAATFTTHATMLGRSIAGSGKPLYDMLENLDPTTEARNSGVMDKFSTEKACAHECESFTTVSEITSIEAEKILGRKADVLVLNGLDMGKFPTFEETSIKHNRNRDKVREFASYYFYPHYYFDMEQTLFFFIVGRYEVRNKGIDVMIKALWKLNDRLKEEGSKKTVIVFFWIPREVHGAKAELSLNKSNYLQIKDFMESNRKDINRKIMHNIMSCPSECFVDADKFTRMELFDKNFLLEAKKLKINFFKSGNPLLVTHNLPNEVNDDVIRSLTEGGLDNKEDDKVKVIHYPVYLTGIDGLIDLPYYEALAACHLGLFPSYYEPWGYTPLESAALGVPALTTDLSGFGRFLMEKKEGKDGIYILHRYGKQDAEVIDEFAEIMYKFTTLSHTNRVKQKMKAKEVSALADWGELVNNYFEAHNQAVDKAWGK